MPNLEQAKQNVKGKFTLGASCCSSLGSSPGHLQQTQYDVLLVFSHDQIVGFEQQAFDDVQRLPAPVDEVADVVSEPQENKT